MKKSLLLISAFFVFITSFALTIPKGKIYFDNSKTKFETVSFAYGPGDAVGTVLVSMTNEGNDVWSYDIPSNIRNIYRYIFLETELEDGTYNYTFPDFKELISSRGEIRTATTDKEIKSNYIFVPEDNTGKNWYQGAWQSKSSFDSGESSGSGSGSGSTTEPSLPAANCNPHSGTLPVVYLKTNSGDEITSKEEYVDGGIYIDALDNTEFTDFGTSSSYVATELKGRGNWTWNGFDKKPYRIKLKKKAQLLNLTTDKSYNLLAHADDNYAFLRNTAGFALSRYFGLNYTPTQVPVELYLNNNYKGLYFMVDHIKVSSNRVKIEEQEDNETNANNITGGWLLEIDNYSEDPHITINKPDGEEMWFTYKSPEELSYQQESYITNFLNRATSAIYSEDKNSTEWEKYIDMDTLVNYYLVYEIMGNREGFHGSCYMHKDRGENTKLVFGPVWDFGNSLWNMDDTYIYEDYPYGIKWIDEIAKFPRFQQAVRKRWVEKRGSMMPYLRVEVDKFIDNITYASQCDCKKWPEYGNKNVLERKSAFYDLLDRRLSWLDTQFGTVGLTEEEAVELSVFPNPTTDKISVNSNEEILSISVYNLAGNKLLDLDVNKTEWSLGLDAGTYILTVETAKNTISRKIIVK